MTTRVLTRLAFEWAVRSFGIEHVQNRKLRALRLLEEAVELAQAFEVPKDKIMNLVEVVYQRPPGDPAQELGGVMVTTAVLAGTYGSNPEFFFEEELARVLAKPPEHFAQRNQEKLDLGMNA